MINRPIIIEANGFQKAWTDAVKLLMENHWELRNLIVQIRKPICFDQDIHNRITDFTQRERILGPKHVAYTIFPHGLYEQKGNARLLFDAYNRPNGLFDRLQKKKPRWGTYFRRMTHYNKEGDVINQLGNIITAIKDRKNVSKAAYTIVIQNPGGETIRPLGGPCLNYLAVQIESTYPITVGLLAVYRNHYFLEGL